MEKDKDNDIPYLTNHLLAEAQYFTLLSSLVPKLFEERIRL
jgi:hypothetical protein